MRITNTWEIKWQFSRNNIVKESMDYIDKKKLWININKLYFMFSLNKSNCRISIIQLGCRITLSNVPDLTFEACRILPTHALDHLSSILYRSSALIVSCSGIYPSRSSQYVGRDLDNIIFG